MLFTEQCDEGLAQPSLQPAMRHRGRGVSKRFIDLVILSLPPPLR